MAKSEENRCLAGSTILCAAPARHEEAQLVKCVEDLHGTALRLGAVGDSDLDADFLVSAGVLTEAYKVFFCPFFIRLHCYTRCPCLCWRADWGIQGLFFSFCYLWDKKYVLVLACWPRRTRFLVVSYLIFIFDTRSLVVLRRCLWIAFNGVRLSLKWGILRLCKISVAGTWKRLRKQRYCVSPV